MTAEEPEVAFALAAAAHLGFQAVVTVLVYPALADTARDHPGSWTAVHGRHSRRIVPLVGAVYGALVVSGAWLLIAAPSPAGVVAVAGAGAAVAVTAVGAGPLHGRLSEPDPTGVYRLLVLDRLRTLAATLALVAAVVACGR